MAQRFRFNVAGYLAAVERGDWAAAMEYAGQASSLASRVGLWHEREPWMQKMREAALQTHGGK